MTTRTVNLYEIDTVGKLRELLKDVPDEAELSLDNSGDTGYINGAEMELVTYDNDQVDVYINVKAESGYY